ncbi:tumor necrosis factor receptor superfamily member 6 [Onychomys torridus]|uniref:tumor necrosis factor receptor superfamily member 6 n=1 Tax=Onychomys torridus TaxID=38674 RepID=UPI00167FA7B0|nr:tumor necrosis factor receptor superfamily member 6 [Onychomys torridus]
MLWIWTLLPLVLAGSPLSIHTQETDSISEGSELRRNVHEIETNCSKGLYRGGQFCCQPCKPGERKLSDCKTDGDKPECFPCKEGKEYMDKEHYSDKCRRCTLCDGEHGLEVETDCTKTQNTKCKCKHNFYCNISVCEHCDRCVTCEHGILEPCTPTSNTKCKRKTTDFRYHFLWLIIPFLVLLLGFLYKKYWRRGHDDPESGISKPENMPINFSDIDLSKHISNIAEQMSLCEVKKFVRKNGISETTIDEIKHDNIQNTAEQKIQLLQHWYQSHGKKDAYHALVTGLKKINCYILAERIQVIVQEDVENSTFRNENERQDSSENYLSSSY